MSEIRFGLICPLTQYLKEASLFNGSGRKAELAAALLYGLDYPRFIEKRVDLTFTAQLIQEIAKTEHTSLLSETREKCVHCPQSNNCEVGALFKGD